MPNCIKCNAKLPEHEGPGRPKDYCSTACRRAAELEIRRLDRRLEALEVRMSGLRLGYGITQAGDEERLSREIERHEARLRSLMAADG